MGLHKVTGKSPVDCKALQMKENVSEHGKDTDDVIEEQVVGEAAQFLYLGENLPK